MSADDTPDTITEATTTALALAAIFAAVLVIGYALVHPQQESADDAWNRHMQQRECHRFVLDGRSVWRCEGGDYWEGE